MSRLEITTMIGCPLMCTFCPQDKLKKTYGAANDLKDKGKKYLSLDNFKRVIDKLPKHIRIDFSGMAEPWANPDCTAMLRYTLERGRRVAIYTTLYGMTEADGDEVVDLARRHADLVDEISVHLPDADNNMPGWKVSKEWLSVFTKFCALGAEGKILVQLMTMNGTGNLHPDLQRLSLKLGDWRGHSRAGSIDNDKATAKSYFVPAPRNEGAVICGMTPFYDQNVLLPNGDVALCCMDYGLKHIIGNLLTQDYYDMFASAEFLRIRKVNMTPGYSACTICKSCDWGLNLVPGENGRWKNELRPGQAQPGT